MTSKCKCFPLIVDVIRIDSIAKIVYEYILHKTDYDVIRDKLGFTGKWVVSANDDHVRLKNQWPNKKQEVTLKIYMSDHRLCIVFDLEETCRQYHSHTKYDMMHGNKDYIQSDITRSPGQRTMTIEYSSELFATLVDRVCNEMNDRILSILAKANRHYTGI